MLQKFLFPLRNFWISDNSFYELLKETLALEGID